MNSLEFYESLEAELAPFTDAEVDAISASTEADSRYRVEIGFIFLFCGLIPIGPAVLGLAAIRAYNLSSFALILACIAMLACIYTAVRLAKPMATPVLSWRYKASFLRQLSAHRRARGL